ncbi:MAG: RNA polymerase sigma factor [bacterium]|nr:RNA polymerase sigma factor [bacterium]
MPPEDGELIQRIVHNDLNAFDELFKKYQNSVYRFACYLTQSRIEADDLFQETWLRAVKYLPTSATIRDFKAWILTIVANRHKDELRKKKFRRLFLIHRSEEPASNDNLLPWLDYESQRNSMDESHRVDFRLALNKAIANLPIKQRRVFVLKEIEGLKHSEISDILNVPIGTIKSLFHRAIKKLQTELAEFKTD